MTDIKQPKDVVKVTSENKEIQVTEIKQRPQRPGLRKLDNEGPLSFVLNLHLEGYKLFLATDNHGGDMFYLQKLLDPTVGYEFVNPIEVGLKDINGLPIIGDKVVIPLKGDQTAYLLKQPIEWANEDRKRKEEIATKGIYNDPEVNKSILPGFKGTKTTFKAE